MSLDHQHSTQILVECVTQISRIINGGANTNLELSLQRILDITDKKHKKKEGDVYTYQELNDVCATLKLSNDDAAGTTYDRDMAVDKLKTIITAERQKKVPVPPVPPVPAAPPAPAPPVVPAPPAPAAPAPPAPAPPAPAAPAAPAADEDYRTTIADLQQQLKDRETRYNALMKEFQGQFKEKLNEITSLEQRIITCGDRIINLEEQLKGRDGTIASLKEMIAANHVTYKEERGANKKIIDALKDAVDTLQQSEEGVAVAKNIADLRALLDVVQNLRKENEQLNSVNDTLKMRCQILIKENQKQIYGSQAAAASESG